MILVRFVIHLHLKDINLLKEIQSYFGVGKIYIANKDNNNDSNDNKNGAFYVDRKYYRNDKSGKYY